MCGRFEHIPHAAHEIGQFLVHLLSLSPEPFRGSLSLPVQHRAKPQGFKQRRRDDPDSPAAEVRAFLILPTWLFHAHESGFFEQRYSPLATALPHAGIPDDGAHVDINKTVGRCGRAQTHGSKVQMPEDDLQHYLAGLPPFAADSPTATATV